MNITKLETSLNDIFVKKAPALPEKAKTIIVQFIPWVTLVLGILAGLSALWLWQWAHTVNQLANTVYEWSSSYGVTTQAVDRMNIFVWISLLIMLVQAVIYIMAFSPLKSRKKSGWNLLFYASLLYVAYGFVSIFIDSYGGFGRFIGDLIGAAIGLYFLFQIREHYLSKNTTGATKPTPTNEAK